MNYDFWDQEQENFIVPGLFHSTQIYFPLFWGRNGHEYIFLSFGDGMVMKCVRRETCELRKKKSGNKNQEKCSDLSREKLGIKLEHLIGQGLREIREIRLDQTRVGKKTLRVNMDVMHGTCLFPSKSP